MPNYQFALNLKKDELIGYVFVPYLLKLVNDSYYEKYKRLTLADIEENTFAFSSWMQKLIKNSNELTHAELNKKFNTKSSKTPFTQYLSSIEKTKKTYINARIEKRQIEMLTIVREHKPLLFRIQDRNSTIYPIDFMKVMKEKLSVRFEFEKTKEKLTYKLCVLYKKKQLDMQSGNMQILTNNSPSIVYNNKLFWFRNKAFNGNKLIPFLTKDKIEYAEKHETFLFNKFIQPAVRKFDCKITGFNLYKVLVKPKPSLIIEQTIFKDFILTPYFTYNKHKTPFYSTKESFVDVLEKNGIYELENLPRDFEKEKEFLKKLTYLGLVKEKEFFKYEKTTTNKYAFFEQISKLVPQLQQAGFTIVNKLFSKEVSYFIPEIQYTTSKKQDWFDLNISVKFGSFIIKFKELKNHILNHIYEYVLPDDTIAIIPNVWFSELQAFARRTDKQNRTSLHKTHYKLLENNTIIIPDKDLQQRITAYNTENTIDLPKNSTAILRTYQKKGYNWLYHLTQQQFGVCLADDMGLGKTLQVITVLQKYFEINPNHHPQSKKQHLVETNQAEGTQLSLFENSISREQPIQSSITDSLNNTWESVLLVLPKSLIYNWILELNKFAPTLSYYVYHKPNRKENFEQVLHNKNIIISTYGVIRKDIEFLEKYHFSYLILDESQAIKNPGSKTYKAVIRLNSQYKISMTGTPIENNLFDIWSQMNFLNHDILGNLQYFKTTYVTAIQDNQEALELSEIKSIISPFILRRLKKNVAKELPEKIEQTIFCKMHDEQANWYETEKSAIRNELLYKKEGKTAIDILAAINRLRQIAIHPRLVKEESSMTSGKFETIIQQIHNIIEQGSKFLIFSSFVKHLKLFQDYFEQHGIAYSMLTGKDNKRQTIVERYENTDAIKPFLISIKAGGVGINLTSANYVFIIDPWWNPFVEQQAIDRTHRIGQDKNVIVYRFISKDTIEEKIIKLQQSKLKMSDALLEQEFSQNMKLADIMALMK